MEPLTDGLVYGKQGRNVVLERKYGVPEIVNDGVTIARDIELADPEQNVGVKLVQVRSWISRRAGHFQMHFWGLCLCVWSWVLKGIGEKEGGERGCVAEPAGSALGTGGMSKRMSMQGSWGEGSCALCVPGVSPTILFMSTDLIV